MLTSAEVSVIAGIVAAVGAPGVTYWVMRKMTASFMEQSKEYCANCKAEINRRLDCQRQKEEDIVKRQARLREDDLPNYAKRIDLEKFATELKSQIRDIGIDMRDQIARFGEKVGSDIRTVHSRIDDLHGG